MAWKMGAEGFTQKPKLYYFPECADFERQFLNATYAGTEDNPAEDMDTDCEDHSCDSARYFVMGSRKGHRVVERRQETGLSANYVYGRNKKAARGMVLRRESPMIQPVQLWPRGNELEDVLVA